MQCAYTFTYVGPTNPMVDFQKMRMENNRKRMGDWNGWFYFYDLSGKNTPLIERYWQQNLSEGVENWSLPYDLTYVLLIEEQEGFHPLENHCYHSILKYLIEPYKIDWSINIMVLKQKFLLFSLADKLKISLFYIPIWLLYNCDWKFFIFIFIYKCWFNDWFLLPYQVVW